MTDTRISAADLLRLAAIASVSPEGSADEVVAILQRTGPAAEPTPDEPGDLAHDLEPAGGAAASDKLAKPE